MRTFVLRSSVLLSTVIVGFSIAPAFAAPPAGFNLHLVAKAGCVVGNANHHYIKKVSDDQLIALLYESDSDDANPVAVELIVTKSGYDKLPAAKKKLFHSHKPEVEKGEISLPGMSPEEAKKTLEFVATTYGRVITFEQMMTAPKLKARGHAQ